MPPAHTPVVHRHLRGRDGDRGSLGCAGVRLQPELLLEIFVILVATVIGVVFYDIQESPGLLSRSRCWLFAANVSAAPENEGWVPLLEPGKAEKMAVMLNDTRRKLGSFQIYTLCTCCGGVGKGYYLPTPCCYNINCSIPNRPFDFCSFTPKVPRPEEEADDEKAELFLFLHFRNLKNPGDL
nr:uncharacterized protein LOC109187960 [Ipomoea batatas]